MSGTWRRGSRNQVKESLIFNLDDLDVKRRLMSHIGTLKGVWTVSLKAHRAKRSLNQNDYYWAAFVTPFAHWLSQEWGETISTDQAHYELRKAILGFKEKVNERTGETMELVSGTRNKDVAEFGEYLDKCAEFLARFAGIVVLPPEMFYESVNKKEKVNV